MYVILCQEEVYWVRRGGSTPCLVDTRLLNHGCSPLHMQHTMPCVLHHVSSWVSLGNCSFMCKGHQGWVPSKNGSSISPSSAGNARSLLLFSALTMHNPSLPSCDKVQGP